MHTDCSLAYLQPFTKHHQGYIRSSLTPPFLPSLCPTFSPSPGNPVSGFVCFNLVVTPVLRKMAGWAQPQLRRLQVGHE